MKKKFISVFASSIMILSMNAAYAKKGLNKTSLKLYTGKKATLKVKGAKKVKWSTNNKNVSVKKGIVKANKAGRATVYAKVGKVTYKCRVTIVNKPSMSFRVTSPTNVVNSKITVKVSSSGGFSTKKYQYTYKLNGKKTIFKAYTKAKSASFIAKQAGTYKILVTMKDGLGTKKSGSASITINPAQEVTQNTTLTTDQITPVTPQTTEPTKTEENTVASSPSIDAMDASSSDVILGDTFKLNAKVSNTTAQTTYNMVVTDAQNHEIAKSNSLEISFPVNEITTYTITLTATNSNDLKATSTYSFTTHEPLIQPKSCTLIVGNTKKASIKKGRVPRPYL